MKVAAFDVDLNRVHGVRGDHSVICYNATEWPFEEILTCSKVLVEVASPIDTSAEVSQSYNRRKWAIGNSMQVGRLMYWAQLNGVLDRFLVSPSNLWTLGHPEKQREAAAGVAGKHNHDIRACICMLAYYASNPEKWVPLSEYYLGLHKKKDKECSSPSTGRK
jgi:hypothetical protein